jgi:hypothetical protein
MTLRLIASVGVGVWTDQFGMGLLNVPDRSPIAFVSITELYTICLGSVTSFIAGRFE